MPKITLSKLYSVITRVPLIHPFLSAKYNLKPKKGVAQLPIYHHQPRILNRGPPFEYTSHATRTSSPDDMESNSIESLWEGGSSSGSLQPAHIDIPNDPKKKKPFHKRKLSI